MSNSEIIKELIVVFFYVSGSLRGRGGVVVGLQIWRSVVRCLVPAIVLLRSLDKKPYSRLSLSTQVYRRALAKCCWGGGGGGNLRWTSIPIQGGSMHVVPTWLVCDFTFWQLEDIKFTLPSKTVAL